MDISVFCMQEICRILQINNRSFSALKIYFENLENKLEHVERHRVKTSEFLKIVIVGGVVQKQNKNLAAAGLKSVRRAVHSCFAVVESRFVVASGLKAMDFATRDSSKKHKAEPGRTPPAHRLHKNPRSLLGRPRTCPTSK